MSKKAKVPVDPYSLTEKERQRYYAQEQQKALELEEKRKKEEEKLMAKRRKEEERRRKKQGLSSSSNGLGVTTTTNSSSSNNKGGGGKDNKKNKKDKGVIVGKVIGTPTNFKREMHIGFDPATGMFEVRFPIPKSSPPSPRYPLLLVHCPTAWYGRVLIGHPPRVEGHAGPGWALSPGNRR